MGNVDSREQCVVEREAKAQTVFADELALIHTPEIQRFVLSVFGNLCPDYFWVIPASSSGRLHSPDETGIGGLVVHTKRAVQWAVQLQQMFASASDISLDETVAALLLHDMMKRGQTKTEEETFASHANAVSQHGIYCSQQIIASGVFPEDAPWAKRIIEAVRDHMGRWTHHPGKSDTEFLNEMEQSSLFVHVCDYCASRRIV